VSAVARHFCVYMILVSHRKADLLLWNNGQSAEKGRQ
jgi:hypothetical protein